MPNPTEILRPSSNGNQVWETYNYFDIDEIVTQPTTPDINDLVDAIEDDSNETESWGCGNAVNSGTVTNLKLWIYAGMDRHAESAVAKLSFTGKTLTRNITIDVGFSWICADWTMTVGYDMLTEMQGVIASITAGSIDDRDQLSIACLYVEITYAMR